MGAEAEESTGSARSRQQLSLWLSRSTLFRMFKALDISGLPKGNFKGGFNSGAVPSPAASASTPTPPPPPATTETPAVAATAPAAVAPIVGPVPYPPVARTATPNSTAASNAASLAAPSTSAPRPSSPEPTPSAASLPPASVISRPSSTTGTPQVASAASVVPLSSATRPTSIAEPLFKGPSSQAPSDDVNSSDLDELESSDEEVPLASTSAAYANAVASTSAAVPKSPKKKRQSFVRVPGTTNVATIPLPHYTIKRSSPNSKLDPNVLIIHPGVTDASRARWPTNTTPGGKVNGALNWYEEQSEGDAKFDQWKEKLGKEVAELLKETQTTAGEFLPVDSYDSEG